MSPEEASAAWVARWPDRDCRPRRVGPEHPAARGLRSRGVHVPQDVDRASGMWSLVPGWYLDLVHACGVAWTNNPSVDVASAAVYAIAVEDRHYEALLALGAGLPDRANYKTRREAAFEYLRSCA